MKLNKNGLSTIVVTVILVALVLGAVVVVWAVVNNLIGSSSESIEISEKCLNIDLRAVTSICAGTPATCDVTFERTGTGTDEIAGVKLVFRNSTSASSVINVTGNIQQLVGKTEEDVATGMVSPNKVGVTVYFKDEAGKERLCQQTTHLEF